MKKHIKVLFFIIFFFLCSFVFSEAKEKLLQFTPSTVITPELSGLFKNNSFEPVEIFTASEIKLLGVENVPDLLSYISGVNVYRPNSSTADISIRGFINNFKMNPTILIDGMEIKENHYNRSYMYNLPINIDDIDRIEVIKDPTKFVNGVESPSGVINIVSKKPELIDKNYLNIYTGSNGLLNSSFTWHGYFLKSYFKISGGYRKINEFHNNKKSMEKEFFSVMGTRFFENSKLFAKAYISNNQLNLFNHMSIGINHKPIPVDYTGKLKDTKFNALLIDYSTSTTDINFYYQTYYGYASILHHDGTEKYEFNKANFSKFTIKKALLFKNFNITNGLIAKYSSTKLRKFDTKKTYSLSLYINTDFQILKNWSGSIFIKNRKYTSLENELSFKLSTTLSDSPKTFYIKAGYAKNFQLPETFNKFYNAKLSMGYNKFLVETDYKPNKSLKSVKVYSTILDIGKKIKNIEFSTDFFYNRIVGLNLIYGNLKLINFKPVINLTTKNFFNFVIHGFESKIKYTPNKNVSFFTSYYLQHVKDKKYNIQGNFLIPRYKILSGALFNFNSFSGSIKTVYVPSIKSRIGKNGDVFNLDLYLHKTFLKNKIEASIIANNIFKEEERNNYYGEKRGRNIIFKLKYNF